RRQGSNERLQRLIREGDLLSIYHERACLRRPTGTLIQPLIPQAKTGRRLKDPRARLNAMLWVLRSGAPWRDLPERFGPWKTVYHHFNSWRRCKVWERILQALQVRLDA